MAQQTNTVRLMNAEVTCKTREHSISSYKPTCQDKSGPVFGRDSCLPMPRAESWKTPRLSLGSTPWVRCAANLSSSRVEHP